MLFVCSPFQFGRFGLPPQDAPEARQLFHQVYRALSDPDSVYGIRINTPAARMQGYIHEQEWTKALSAYDAALQTNLVSGGGPPSDLQVRMPSFCARL